MLLRTLRVPAFAWAKEVGQVTNLSLELQNKTVDITTGSPPSLTVT